MNRYLLLIRVALRASRLILFGLIVLALILTGTPLTSVEAAAGDLDPTFGSGGKVTTDFGNDYDYASAIAIQSDGKPVAAGFSFASGTDNNFALARYNLNGTLDFSFGTGGKVTTDFFGKSDVANDIAIQPDGKIVAAGGALNDTTGSDFALARYNSDGSLDTGFGSGGKVTTNFFRAGDTATAIAIQPDGKIVVAGSALNDTTGSDFALARYNNDGSLDTSFGSGGKVTTDFFGDSDEARTIAIQSDGKLVAAGTIGKSGTVTDFALARYNLNGTLDVSFGTGGKVTTDFFGKNDGLGDIAIQPDGKIVAAGLALNETAGFHFALARYNSDGSLDTGFGSGGKVTTIFFGPGDLATTIAIQSDGKIVAAGYVFNSTSDFALARLNNDGSLDASFGSGGKVTTDFFGSRDGVQAIAIQADGKIVAAGFTSVNNTGSDFALARYRGASFDLCIQDDSSGNLLQIDTTTGDYQFSNCGGLTLGGTGTLTRRGSTITLQHNAMDRRVIATIDTSTNKATASLQLFAQGRTFGITDRNITNNTCACR
ncbi:MAG: hypothetical protein ACJ74G_00360 [Blastocatellia bacterium]